MDQCLNHGIYPGLRLVCFSIIVLFGIVGRIPFLGMISPNKRGKPSKVK